MSDEHRVKSKSSTNSVRFLRVCFEKAVCQFAEVATSLDEAETMDADSGEVYEPEADLCEAPALDVDIHEHESGLIE